MSTNLFARRYRGFRVINLIGVGLLATMILGVYLAKTMAWGERNKIAAIDTQIRAEQLRVRLLEAEVAHLEQPRRLAALSSMDLGMAPITAKQEIDVSDLQRFAKPKPIEATPVSTGLAPAGAASVATIRPAVATSADSATGVIAPTVIRQ